jgi:hypothetical protein
LNFGSENYNSGFEKVGGKQIGLIHNALNLNIF